jgi:hypothetical protein
MSHAALRKPRDGCHQLEPESQRIAFQQESSSFYVRVSLSERLDLADASDDRTDTLARILLTESRGLPPGLAFFRKEEALLDCFLFRHNNQEPTPLPTNRKINYGMALGSGTEQRGQSATWATSVRVRNRRKTTSKVVASPPLSIVTDVLVLQQVVTCVNATLGQSEVFLRPLQAAIARHSGFILQSRLLHEPLSVQLPRQPNM